MQPTLWLLDDDVDITSVLHDILQEAGYAIQVFHTWEMAQVALQTSQPELFVVDVWLGNTDGRLIVQHLKMSAATRNIPVIILSALADTAAISQAAGADDWLEKPCTIADLLHKIQRFVSVETHD